jgi:hypothetical protein
MRHCPTRGALTSCCCASTRCWCRTLLKNCVANAALALALALALAIALALAAVAGALLCVVGVAGIDMIDDDDTVSPTPSCSPAGELRPAFEL